MEKWRPGSARYRYAWRRVCPAEVQALEWNGLIVSGCWLLEHPANHALLLVDCCPDTNALFLRPLVPAEVDELPFPVSFVGRWLVRRVSSDED